MPRHHSPITTVATLLLAGCASGSPRTSTTAAGPAPECSVVFTTTESSRAGAAPHDEPISIALPGPVDPVHAPWPRGASERLVFAQLYEPLLRVDCTGRIVGAIARSWTMDSSHLPAKTEWSFVLRDDLRFRSGELATAGDVVASWRSSAAAHAGEATGALIAAIADGAHAIDDSTLGVTLPDSLSSPHLFASAQLAVARRPPDGSWPDGTTSYYVAIDSDTTHRAISTAASSILLRSSDTHPPLRFELAARSDPRDVLDAGIDLLRTSSAAAVQYAATQPDRSLAALPWSATYILALPSRNVTIQIGENCVDEDSRRFRAALATAVHGEVRGAEGPFWWGSYRGVPDTGIGRSAAPCHALERAPSEHSSSDASTHADNAAPRRLVYPRGDAAGRELAERIVALAAVGSDSASRSALAVAAPWTLGAGAWRAVALDSLEFARALAGGREPAYIFALPRSPTSDRFAIGTLLARAPWFAPLDRRRAHIVPLIDTRETLIARRKGPLPSLTIDRDGTLIFGTRRYSAARSQP